MLINLDVHFCKEIYIEIVTKYKSMVFSFNFSLANIFLLLFIFLNENRNHVLRQTICINFRLFQPFCDFFSVDHFLMDRIETANNSFIACKMSDSLALKRIVFYCCYCGCCCLIFVVFDPIN